MATTMDIAICIDCSSSIASYFERIRSNILSIFNQSLSKHQNDVRMALIEFRSHTDYLVTNTYPFTSSLNTFQEWINAVRAEGENSNECKAIADALDASLALEWRSTKNDYEFHEKLVILFTDGPPCNLLNDECSLNYKDLWKIADEFEKQDITLVVIGIEPSVVVCDDFYCALAQKTGGEYIPLINALHVLTSVIQRALLEEDTITQLFRHFDIHFDIEYGSEYHYSAVQKRAYFMIENCQTLADIRKLLYTYLDQPTKFFIDKINDDVYDDYGNSSYNSEHHTLLWNRDCLDDLHNKHLKIVASTPAADDEGYRTRLPTTASSAASSFIQIIGSSDLSMHSDFDWNSEIDDESY